MQVTQHQEDQVLELKAAIGTFVKKRIDVFRFLVRDVDIVDISICGHIIVIRTMNNFLFINSWL